MICRILLLIILTSCVSGSFVVNVTQTCYQAEENHNITLEWTFTTKPDRSNKTLNILCELFINDKLSVLHHVHEGVEVSESQDAKFSGRVQSDKHALREGRIRLQLSRLRTDDSGLYLCEVNTDYGFGVGRCRLNVTAAADQLQPPRPTLSSREESRERTSVYIVLGLTATALMCVSLAAVNHSVLRKNKKRKERRKETLGLQSFLVRHN
ncbi:uncharacterized protein LOC120725864 isoform X1 [Simochromis diagramma]|uniref:uncharacterized protein LOC120725864 isoform X1 n=1 Tax=Simochromis diagramma TaxID=43689 RepID=UPI001A7EEA1E|nr:uncharacterized protein LOC120725864 isoform X1 [Simochromis diagramma]XP_039874855.1 uncharacterized protein LOC120725864 isoform X1 [Simochromis diagramma]